MSKRQHIEKAEMDIAHLLYDKPWYSDWDGCLQKAKEIIGLPQIYVKRIKEDRDVTKTE